MSIDKIVERIERKLGVPGMVQLLAQRLTPTDLQSILLQVVRQRAQQRRPSDVLADYESNRFVRPAAVSPSCLLEWEQAAYAHLPTGFQLIALSPVCPLGTSSAVGLVDQNRVVSTIRNTEVVSDSTNVLALECAVQRRELLRADPKSKVAVHLAASHRLLRAQQYGDPRAVTHFSAFALCSAGQDQGNLQFELSTLRLHINFYVQSLTAFLGPDFRFRVAITDFSPGDRSALLTERLIAPLQATLAHAECVMDDERTDGRNYYAGLCFHIYALMRSGERLELADGGLVDWTQQLLSNAKERCLVSGIGSERLCAELKE